MTALDWSLLALKIQVPVLRYTQYNYDRLTMTFEHRHCVETRWEMDVGSTALYQLDSRCSSGSPSRRLTDATHSAVVP